MYVFVIKTWVQGWMGAIQGGGGVTASALDPRATTRAGMGGVEGHVGHPGGGGPRAAPCAGRGRGMGAEGHACAGRKKGMRAEGHVGVEGMRVREGVGDVRGTNMGGMHWEVGTRWKGGMHAGGAVGGPGEKAPGAPANGNAARARAFAAVDSASGLVSLPDRSPSAYGFS